MMSRFEWLEMEPPEGSVPLEEAGAPIPTSRSLFAKGEEQFLSGSFEEALRSYSRACSEDKSFVLSWVKQVYCQVELGQYKESMIWAEKVLSQFPKHPLAIGIKAYAGAFNGAEVELESMLQALNLPGAQDDPEFLFMLAFCQLKKDLVEEAKATIDAISRLTNFSNSWYLRIGQLLLAAGQAQAALDILRTIERTGSLWAWGYYLLAKCELVTGNRGGARRAVRRCLELDPAIEAARDLIVSMNRKGSSWSWGGLSELWQ